MNYFIRLMISFLFIISFLVPSLTLIASPMLQEGPVTLQIANQINQTICGVTAYHVPNGYIIDDSTLLIKPGASQYFTVPHGQYLIALTDCHGNYLLMKMFMIVSKEYAITVDEDAIRIMDCLSQRLQGKHFFEQAKYEDALQSHLSALACFQATGNRLEEGVSLRLIGQIERALGQHSDALGHYYQSLAIARETHDRVNEANIFGSLGGIYRVQGRYSEALEAYQQALAIVRKMSNRVSEGIVLNNIGLVYQEQGRYRDALESVQQALVIAREVGDCDDEGNALIHLSGIHNILGHYAEAIHGLQQALSMHCVVDNYQLKGTALRGISAVYKNQGRYKEALEVAQQALLTAREVGDRADIGDSLAVMGIIYREQGQYREAIDSLEQALGIAREVGDRSRENAALNNIGGAYRGLGRYAEALETYQQALAIARARESRSAEGSALNNMSTVLDDQGRVYESLESLAQALLIMREVGDRGGEGMVLLNMGGTYTTLRRHTEALESLQQALLIMREIGDHAHEGIILKQIGVVYITLSRYTEGLEILHQALTIIREVGDLEGEVEILFHLGVAYGLLGRSDASVESLQQALTIARQLGFHPGEGMTLLGLGLAYEAQGQPIASQSYYAATIDFLESIRATAGTDIARSSIMDVYSIFYSHIIGVNYEQNNVEEAFVISERSRARSFLDSLSTGRIELSDDNAAKLFDREVESYIIRQAAQAALAQALALNPSAPQLVGALKTRLVAVEQAHNTVLDAIADRHDQLIDIVPGRKRVLQLAEVQALLDDHTTLISYWMLGDKTISFIVTSDAFTAVELPNASAQRISLDLQNLNQWRNRENAHPLPLRSLYRLLIEPLAERLQTPHIVIVPHQLLHYVPFAALTDGRHYLGQQHTLSLLPSASMLRFLNENTHNIKRADNPTAAIFGNPRSRLSALPYAEAEAQAVADLIGANLYTGTQASEIQLRAIVSGTNILHLAAHGDYNIFNPLYSAIALAPTEEEDGLLETREIFGLPLKGNDLVVLSGCQTNLNELTDTGDIAISRGDEIVGLTRAFFFAGAPTVISSLWNVDDAATEALMVSFYTHWLQEGLSKAAALQAAQADVRAKPRWASPFYWAGFVLNGHPGAPKKSE